MVYNEIEETSINSGMWMPPESWWPGCLPQISARSVSDVGVPVGEVQRIDSGQRILVEVDVKRADVLLELLHGRGANDHAGHIPSSKEDKGSVSQVPLR